MRLMWRALVLLLVACVCVAGCNKKEPKPPDTPDPGNPTGDVRVTPGDRLGWTQQAPDATDLASFVTGGASTAESARLAALRVIARTTTSFSAPSRLVVTAEQVQLNLVPVAEGLQLPSDLAFAPDGSIFIAERGGIVRLLREGVLVETPALALDWQPASETLWVVDRVGADAGRLSAVVKQAGQSRAAFRTSYALPAGTGAASAAFYRGGLMPMFNGNLFIAAETARQLIRLRFDPDNASKIVSVERMLSDEIGPVRVVSNAPDGGLYVATESVLYRLAP